MRYEPMVGQPRQACQLPEKIQLKRIRKFLGLQNAVTYIDSRGRKRCVWYSMWLSRVLQFYTDRNAPSNILFKVGGKHLRMSQIYPGEMGIQVTPPAIY